MSARQVRLHRMWLRVDHRWDGGIPDLHPCSSLTSVRAPEPQRTWCLLPLATQQLQPPVGQSWDGGNPRLTPPVALAGVYGHMLTFYRSWTPLLHETGSQGTLLGACHISIRPGTCDSLMLQCTGHALSSRTLRSGTTVRVIQWRILRWTPLWKCNITCSCVRLVPEFRIPLCNERSSAFPLCQTGQTTNTVLSSFFATLTKPHFNGHFLSLNLSMYRVTGHTPWCLPLQPSRIRRWFSR